MDAGPALSAEDPQRVFDRFYRAGSSRTRYFRPGATVKTMKALWQHRKGGPRTAGAMLFTADGGIIRAGP